MQCTCTEDKFVTIPQQVSEEDVVVGQEIVNENGVEKKTPVMGKAPIFQDIEVPYKEGMELPSGTPILGRNRVICQFCLDNNASRDKEKSKQAIQQKLADIDLKSIRSIRTNDTARMFDFETQAVALRKQLSDLG